MDRKEYDSMFSVALSTKSQLEVKQQQLQSVLSKKEEVIKQMHDLQSEQNLYETSIDILKGLVSKLSRHHIDHLEKLINTSVKTIFFDRKYTIEFEITTILFSTFKLKSLFKRF